jgi:putative ABC transport system substrate-binding protein
MVRLPTLGVPAVDRRGFIIAIAPALLTVRSAAQAQQTDRIYRLGLLHPGPQSTLGTGLLEILTVPMRELGYTEARNLVIEARFAEDHADRLRELARELALQRPEVILAIGTPAVRAAKEATTTIPIVFLTNVDPVAAGLVASLARPGSNVTGMMIAPEGTLAEKKLALLKEMVPKATRIALLTPDSAGGGMSLQVEEVRKAAASLGLELIVIEGRGGDYAKAFSTIIAARPAALFVGAASRFVRDRRQIIELAAKHRLPAIYEWPRQVKDGGLMSYGASDIETYRRLASYVDRIFRGARPSELPIEQPSKLMLVINLTSARAMGLTVPQSLLLRADELIQ